MRFAGVVALMAAADAAAGPQPTWSVVLMPTTAVNDAAKARLTAALVDRMGREPGSPMAAFKDTSSKWSSFPSSCDDNDCWRKLVHDAGSDRVVVVVFDTQETGSVGVLAMVADPKQGSQIETAWTGKLSTAAPPESELLSTADKIVGKLSAEFPPLPVDAPHPAVSTTEPVQTPQAASPKATSDSRPSVPPKMEPAAPAPPKKTIVIIPPPQTESERPSVSFAAAHATELTRVASSSFDQGPRIGLRMELGLERTQRLESIGRDRHTNGEVDVSPELRYQSADYRLNIDARVGLWRDLELHYGLPLVFVHTEEWWLSSLQSPTASPVLNNCVNANGTLVNANCATTGAGAVPMFSTPISTLPGAPQVYRGGFGNMHFGLSWAAYSHERDGAWVVGLDYEAPTADRLDPTDLASDTQHGALGDRVHKYQLWSAFSRRYGPFDPYLKVDYTLPAAGPAWYSNCDHPDPSIMGVAANCNSPTWTRESTGILFPNTAELVAGAELVVYDPPASAGRVTVDARAHTTFVPAGRYYNELSGLTRKLMYTEDYLQVGGSLAVFAKVAEYFTARVRTTLSFETDHLLSNEPLGQDLNNNGQIDFISNSAEVNPNFDFRMDMVSRQFRASAIYVFDIEASASFSF